MMHSVVRGPRFLLCSLCSLSTTPAVEDQTADIRAPAALSSAPGAPLTTQNSALGRHLATLAVSVALHTRIPLR